MSDGAVGRGVVGALATIGLFAAIASMCGGCSTIQKAGIGNGTVSAAERAALNAARPGAGDLLAGVLGGDDDGGYVATVTITDATGHVLVPPYTIDETKRRTRTVGALTEGAKGGGWAAILDSLSAIQSNQTESAGTIDPAVLEALTP